MADEEDKLEYYVGRHLYGCVARPYDWSDTYALIVSGDSFNPCGHALLQVGSDRFHIDGWNYRPWHLTHAGYLRFLKESGKKQLRKDRIHIPDPLRAQRKLEELSVRPWRWGVVVHNCASFVEEIVQAGGARGVGVYSNCPARETFR